MQRDAPIVGPIGAGDIGAVRADGCGGAVKVDLFTAVGVPQSDTVMALRQDKIAACAVGNAVDREAVAGQLQQQRRVLRGLQLLNALAARAQPP